MPNRTYSRNAARLWSLLTDRQPRRISIGELCRDLNISKTKVQNALFELEEAGLIFTEVVE